MKVTKTQRTVLRKSGVVRLVRLERRDCPKPLFGVTAPQKISGLDGPDRCEQFMTLQEAEHCFERYVKYFEWRAK